MNNKEKAKTDLINLMGNSITITGLFCDLVIDSHCPKSHGFEGPDTFSSCGQCLYCLLEDIICDSEI